MWEKITRQEKRLNDDLPWNLRITLLNDLAWALRGIDLERSTQYLSQAKRLAKQYKCATGLARARLTEGFQEAVRGYVGPAFLGELHDMEALFARQADHASHGLVIGLQSVFYWRHGHRDRAFGLAVRALDLVRDTQHIEVWGWGESILGSFYLDLKDYTNALPRVQKAQELFESIGEPVGQASCMNNRGVIHRMLGEFELALAAHERSMELAQQVGHKDVYARSLRDRGRVLEAMGNFQEALPAYQESLRVRESVQNVQGIVTSETDLGRVWAQLGEYSKAELFLNHAKKNAERLMAQPKLVEILYELAQLYKMQGDASRALQYFEQYMALQNKVEGEQGELHIRNLQAAFELERSKQEAEIERLRHVELRKLYDQIERQQEDMLASIRYARGIQKALLQPIAALENGLPEGWVFYEPKDIVSGDYYWYAEVGDKQLIAAVDCTGHGVPGAFMVVLSNGLLNEIVLREGILEPEAILQELDERLLGLLQRRNAQHFSYDGLDIALVQRDLASGQAQFAGAKRPLLILRAGEVYQVKGSRPSIGGWLGESELKKTFKQVVWQSEPGDRFFLFSDGFPDQFGGEKGKKYGARKFRQFIAQMPCDPIEARKAIHHEHLRWRGAGPQTDDIIVLSWREPSPR